MGVGIAEADCKYGNINVVEEDGGVSTKISPACFSLVEYQGNKTFSNIYKASCAEKGSLT